MSFDQCSILHSNLTPAASLSGGSWLAGLPLANLQTTEMAARARSTSAAEAHTKVLIDHGSAVTARVFWLAAHNLSSAAQFRILRGTTSGGSDVYSGTMASAWDFTPPAYSGEVYGAFVVLPATSARYSTLEISDTGNAAGYVEIGQLLVGDVLTFSFGPLSGLQHGLNDLSTVTKAESGAPWATQRRKLRSVSLILDGIDDDDANELQDIRQTIGTHGQAIYLPSLTDKAQTQRYGFVGHMTELSAIDYPWPRLRTLPIRMTEWV